MPSRAPRARARPRRRRVRDTDVTVAEATPRPQGTDAGTARMLRLLGLGVRSRGAVVGVERVREAAGRGTLQLAVVAPDASPHSLHKVRPLLAARGVPVLDGPSATELGHAVGREATAVVGVTDANLARGITALYVTHVTQQDREAGVGPADPDRAPRGGPARGDTRRTD